MVDPQLVSFNKPLVDPQLVSFNKPLPLVPSASLIRTGQTDNQNEIIMAKKTQRHSKGDWSKSPKTMTLDEYENYKKELRDRLTIARRSDRREFLRDLTRTETDPFTHDKIYKRTDGTKAYVETRAILEKPKKTVLQPDVYRVQTHQYFSDPLRTAICHARKLRRRVMFALGLTRRGAGSGRRHVYTDTSRIRCA